MASWDDVGRIALGLPDAAVGQAHEGSPAYPRTEAPRQGPPRDQLTYCSSSRATDFSRISTFRILPVTVIGKSSTRTM
jgi:hypothetical protein